MEQATIQLGIAGPARKSRKLRTPRLLLLLLATSSVIAIVVIVQHAQTHQMSSADLAAMQGEWQLIKVAYGGKAAEPNHGSWTIRGNQLQSQLRFEDRLCTFTIHPNRSPKEVIFKMVGDGAEGWNHGIYSRDGREHCNHGIYAIDGDTLTVCLAKDENPRPTAFLATGGDQNVLLVFRRDRR